MWWRTIVFWFALMALAILNGTVRVKWIIPYTGLATGLAVSTLMLCTPILLATWSSIAWIGPATAGQAWAVGMTWLAMTLAFEFLAGHFLFKKPWPELLYDYNVLQGRVWVLVPIVTMFAPWLMAKVRGLIPG